MDWNEALAITPLNTNFSKFVIDEGFEFFYKKLKKHDLDSYTYLITKGLNDETIGVRGNTQHPSQDIKW